MTSLMKTKKALDKFKYRVNLCKLKGPKNLLNYKFGILLDKKNLNAWLLCFLENQLELFWYMIAVKWRPLMLLIHGLSRFQTMLIQELLLCYWEINVIYQKDKFLIIWQWNTHEKETLGF